MDIADILIKSTKKRQITYLPTKSERNLLSIRTLNTIIQENHEYANTVYILSMLPALIWSYKLKAKKEFEIQNFEKQLFPSNNQNQGYDYAIINKKMVEIIELVNEGILSIKDKEGECLKAIHLIGYEDVSNFIMKNYYQSAVINLCEMISVQLNNKVDKLMEYYENLSAEDLIAFHDINLLFDLLRSSKKAKDKNFFDNTADCLNQLATLLSTYVVEPKEIKQIMCLYINGETEMSISEKTNKSRTYIRTRIAEGKEAISILLWGITSRRSIEWFRKGI